MDWANERYVRVYTRDTADLMAVGWEGRTVLWELLRKADRAGIVEGDEETLAELLRMPREVAEAGIQRLLERNVVLRGELDGAPCFIVKNYTDAQEARSSDAQRQRECRARRRAKARLDDSPESMSTWIYFIQREDGPVKIGFTSRDPIARKKEITKGFPETAKVLHAMVGTVADERALHDRFDSFNIRGEWFRPEPALMSYIASLGGDTTWRDEYSDSGVGPSSRQVVTTGGHTTVSHGVTPSLAVPSRTTPSRAVLNPDPERAHTRRASTEPRQPEAEAPSDPTHGAILDELRRHPILADLDHERAAEVIAGYVAANGRPLAWHLDAIRRTAAAAEGAAVGGQGWERGSIGRYLMTLTRNPDRPRADRQDDRERAVSADVELERKARAARERAREAEYDRDAVPMPVDFMASLKAATMAAPALSATETRSQAPKRGQPTPKPKTRQKPAQAEERACAEK